MGNRLPSFNHFLRFFILGGRGQDPAEGFIFIKKQSENGVNKCKKENIGLMISLKFSYSAVP